MKKEDILEKSRKENIHGDERDVDIKRKSNENGFLAILFVLIVLGLLLSIQEWTTGSSFINPRYVQLVIMIAMITVCFTKYHYTKQRKYLIVALFVLVCVMVGIVGIVTTDLM